MMKTFRRIIPLALLGLMCVGAGCQQQNDTHYDYVNVPLGSHNVVLSEEDVQDVQIGIASDSYQLRSDNTDIVTAELVEGAIRLTAHAVGKTMIHLSDDGYKRARMLVEVKKLYELTLEAIPGGLEYNRQNEMRTI